MAVEHEHVCAGILHEVLAEIVDQKGYCGGLAGAVGGGERHCMTSLVVEEQLETAARFKSGLRCNNSTKHP